MLVQFMLKNVLSFKEETILDLSAISAYKEHQENLIDHGMKEKYVRVAAIYGANASGKSNLNKAMRYFQRIVVESMNNVENGEKTAIQRYYRPFSLDEVEENSEFQIVEVWGQYEYKYGFEYNSEYIVAEWLYQKNLETNRTSIIFERTAETIELGSKVRKECELYKNQIPQETLVLTFFNKLKLDTNVFKAVYSAILCTLIVSSDFYDETWFFTQNLPEAIDEQKDELLSFLSAIDTGIKDITYDRTDNRVQFTTYHKGIDDKLYPLNLFAESEGTLKSIVLFMCAKNAISYHKSMFIDELNIKLHPLLLKFIIDLFYNKNSDAQLIYTTHDTTLLDKKFFRRDQIWFVQKDDYGHSELSALSDFKVRSDASFEKDYLAGVYGGIPLLKEFCMKEGDGNGVG